LEPAGIDCKRNGLVRLGARSKNQFKRLGGIFGPSGPLRDASAAWWPRPHVLSAAAALFGISLSCLAWFAASERENRLAHQEFAASAGDHLLILQNGVDQYINDISALRAAFQASERGINRREFQSLSDLLFHEKNAIYATSWLPRVTRGERAAHELEAAREGLSGYGIKSIAPDGSLSPAKEADEYFPVFYSSREFTDSFVYGHDNNDGGTGGRALERARDTDRAAASQNIVLRRGEGDRNGFLVALPVYKQGVPHDTVEERRGNLTGFIQGVFQTGVMIESILTATINPTGMDLYFFAADAGAAASPLYFHPSRLRGGPAAPLSREALAAGLHWSGALKVADQRWTFVAAPIPDRIGAASHWGSWVVLFGGLAITGIMTAYLWTAHRSAERLRLGNQALGRVNAALDAANEHLLAQNARFDSALNNMTQGLGFFDGAQRLIVCNRRLFEMYDLPLDRMKPGITLAEITDLRWEAGTAPAMNKEDYLRWRNSITISNEPTDTTVELENGRIIRIRRQPMSDGGWVATHEDITEQRRSEQALAETRVNAERAQQDAQAAHARLVEAFNVVPEGIALMDADDRLVLWNNQYAETYRATGTAIVAGMRFEDLLRKGLAGRQYKDAIDREEEWLAERLAGHALPSNRHEQLLSSGRYIVVEERRTANGGSIGVRIDMTEMKQREESFRLLFKGNPMPMWVIDRETLRFLAVNSAAVAHYGYSRDEFLQMTALDLRAADDRDELREYIREGRGSQGGNIWRHHKADGTVILISVYHADLIYDGHAARLCAAVDVTERTRAEEKLLEQKLRTDSAINNMSQGLLMFDSQARLILCNERYIEMYNLSAEVVKPGCTLRQLVEHRKELGSFSGDPEQYCRDILKDVTEGAMWSRTIELSGGRTIHVVNRPMPGGGWVATHEDITERRQAQERIEYLAHHDPMTGLPNRTAFNDYLAEAIENAARQREKIAVVCIDLDRFKEVNDVFGHAAGDRLLREISKRLKDTAAGAFVARLGGDEFSLVLTDGPQPATAEHLTARLLAAAAADIEIDGHPVRCGLSIGVTIYPTDGADAAALLANADAGLYRAKGEGRGSVRFFDAQMDHRLRERRALQQDLRTAIEHGEIRLYYQPQASIDGNIIGFEALARWQHPTRGVISPGVFIPLAEESGVIIEIGEWILREACRRAAAWDRPLQIAINLSPVQFRHGDLPNLVHSILLETGLAPHRLELEVTESVLIDDFSRAVSILRRLKALGARIAMDDFGTGYSSLSYLQAFPFDKIKIDQAFIANLDKNPQSAAIVRAIIGLGRALSLPVTAEGVETREQLAFLARESCDEIQGFLIGKPLPIEEYAGATHGTPPKRKISHAV
jgi:diguanylate cyclase (GGDEF)-like protein/PAS domain S-box-containing protein